MRLKLLLTFQFSTSGCCGFCSAGNVDYMEGLWTETDKIRSQHGYDSSSNSNSSSIGSISSSSSDSDCKTGASELEADADSLSCRQSGLSSNDQSANSGRKLVCSINVLRNRLIDFIFFMLIHMI